MPSPRQSKISGPVSRHPFGHPLRVAIYCRVSTIDQQTLPMQEAAIREYIAHRGWKLDRVVSEAASGAKTRPRRNALIEAARRREIDAIVVWKLDRWGRSLADLVTSIQELTALGIAFVSLTEALDLSTPMGRAMAGMLSVFAEFERDTLRERVKAGMAHARSKGKHVGRPRTSSQRSAEVIQLHRKRVPKAEIARRLDIPRTSVIRMIQVSQQTFDQFKQMLDSPPKPNERLRRLMQTPSRWEK